MFYAVKKGLAQGVYKDWESCKKNVNKVPGAVFKGFKSENEAWAWLGVRAGRTGGDFRW